MGGLSYLEYVRQLAKRVESEEGWQAVRADLEAIRAALLQRWVCAGWGWVGGGWGGGEESGVIKVHRVCGGLGACVCVCLCVLGKHKGEGRHRACDCARACAQV